MKKLLKLIPLNKLVFLVCDIAEEYAALSTNPIDDVAVKVATSALRKAFGGE